MKYLIVLFFVSFVLLVMFEEIVCVIIVWKLIGVNYWVCVYVYDDFKIFGVICYVSQV